jgi:hypothetical protein
MAQLCRNKFISACPVVMNHLGSTFHVTCLYGYRRVLAARDSHDTTT